MTSAPNKKPYEAVLFDVDGTLVDSAPDMCRALNLALRDVGRPPVQVSDIYDMIGGIGRGKITDQVIALTGGPKEVCDEAEIFTGFRNYYFSDLLFLTRPYPLIPDLLADLHSKNIKMAACTNKNEKSAREMLEQIGWADYFPVILGGDSLSTRKPEPEMLLHAAERLGVLPQNSLMVGDTISDTLAANRAGMDCAFVSYGYSVMEQSDLEYRYHIDDVSELLTLFQ